jgi:hypothetical protein
MHAISKDDFTALLRQAGLDPAPETLDEMYRVYPRLAAMLLRNRGDRDRPAEPALTFEALP